MVTNMLYWIAIITTSAFAPWMGVRLAFLVIPDHTDAMAGFYIPPAVLALPVTIPACVAAVFSALYFLVLTPTKNLEQRKLKYKIAEPSFGFGLVAACCGSLVGCLLRTAAH